MGIKRCDHYVMSGKPKKLVPLLPSEAIPDHGYILMGSGLEPFVLGITSVFSKVSRPTIYAMIADGRLPQPIKVGAGPFNGWPASQIKAMVASLEEQGA